MVRHTRWREQGGEERCQLRQLIGERGPKPYLYWVNDTDIRILDKRFHPPVIMTIEKKIGGAEYKPWQMEMDNLWDALIKDSYKKHGIDYIGHKLVRVPDNKNYRDWEYIDVDGTRMTVDKFTEFICNLSGNQEGGYKID